MPCPIALKGFFQSSRCGRRCSLRKNIAVDGTAPVLDFRFRSASSPPGAKNLLRFRKGAPHSVPGRFGLVFLPLCISIIPGSIAFISIYFRLLIITPFNIILFSCIQGCFVYYPFLLNLFKRRRDSFQDAVFLLPRGCQKDSIPEFPFFCTTAANQRILRLPLCFCKPCFRCVKGIIQKSKIFLF